MRPKSTLTRASLALAVALAMCAAVWWGPFLAFHLLPPEWTGEADRLAALLDVERGAHVAEIGAGSGALALAMARRAGEEGRVYATELSEERRGEIAGAASAAGATNVVVVAAQPRESGLEPACCDAIYMRHVFHHVEAPDVMAAQLRGALRPGGRLAVIDFPPGRLEWHLGPDHGASSGATRRIFEEAGFRLLRRESDWGGGSYLLLFGPAAGEGEAQSPQTSS